jgi:hypothetical protein
VIGPDDPKSRALREGEPALATEVS